MLHVYACMICMYVMYLSNVCMYDMLCMYECCVMQFLIRYFMCMYDMLCYVCMLCVVCGVVYGCMYVMSNVGMFCVYVCALC